MIIHGTDYNGVCACGHTHIMTTELSVIESGCLRNIKKYMEESGISVFRQRFMMRIPIRRPWTGIRMRIAKLY